MTREEGTVELKAGNSMNDSIFDRLQANIASRPEQQLRRWASTRSVAAMNSLVTQALAGAGYWSDRETRLRFICIAVGATFPLLTTTQLSQAHVSVLIDWLKAPEDWTVAPGIEQDLAAVWRRCLEEIGQQELPGLVE